MSFKCEQCGKAFDVPEAALKKYPGWTPKTCLACRDKKGSKSSGGAKKRAARPRSVSSSAGELNLPVAEVLKRFTDGPHDGVFTDGACSGNPGPGGWGCVWVRDDQVVEQRHGHAEHTTNNRMELMALIEAYKLLPEDIEVTIWTDSRLCVNTINDWAAGWEKRGWRRKSGPIANLELVQEAYRLANAHPNVTLAWIKAHNGSRWNEYADALATAYARGRL